MKQRDVERIVKLEAEIERLQGKINDAKRKIALIRNQNSEAIGKRDCNGRMIYTSDFVRYYDRVGIVIRDIYSDLINPWYIQYQDGGRQYLNMSTNNSKLEILS